MSCSRPRTCFAEIFALILSGLQKAMGAAQTKVVVDPEVVRQTWNRISRLSAGFLALVAVFRAGRLRPPRPVTRRSPPKSPPQSKPFRFPSKFGWMVRFGSEVCCSRSQLEHWLNTNADAAAFIAAAPRQAGRILRPLCHMLGIELPEALRPPKRSRRQRPGGSKPAGDGVAAPAEGSSGSRALARRAGSGNKPTKAEIRSWMPGQKRPLPFPQPGRRARNKRPLVPLRPKMA